MIATAKRTQKLPKPRLQLKVIAVFLSMGIVCVAVQFEMFSRALTEAGTKIPQGYMMTSMLLKVLSKQLLLTLGLLTPLMISVGILVTFRIAGPIYRFERYLREVADGAPVEPIRIRKGDELQDLCDAINGALAAVQKRERAAVAELVAAASSKETTPTT